jgi:hypothetical protein
VNLRLEIYIWWFTLCYWTSSVYSFLPLTDSSLLLCRHTPTYLPTYLPMVYCSLNYDNHTHTHTHTLWCACICACVCIVHTYIREW